MVFVGVWNRAYRVDLVHISYYVDVFIFRLSNSNWFVV